MVPRCTSCGAAISDSAISREIEAARCSACGAIVDLRGEKAIPKRTHALVAPVPEGWRVEEGGAGIRVRWRWFSPAGLIPIAFALFWNAILLTFAYAITDQLAHPERLLVGLLIPHVWVGIGLTYYCLTLFNSTTIEAGIGSVSIRFGPVPWWRKNKNVSAGEMQQLFVIDHCVKNRVTYQLCAVMRDGRKQTLITDLPSEEKARFLETRLERILAIEDRPVEGEIPARKHLAQPT